MGHEVDWSKFPKPWNALGPKLQASVRQDTARIVEGKSPSKPPLPDRWFSKISYPKTF